MEANISKPSFNRFSKIIFSLLFIFAATVSVSFAQAKVRVKDIARLSGDRQYQLIGYGLVTGLDGTGDQSEMSIEMIRGMLRNMGMELTPNQIDTENSAAVVVTAMLPAYGRPGEPLGIIISSIGDAESLQGGVLLPTLLKGGDGKVYAVAQGQISIGGFEQAGGAAGRRAGQKNHLTVGHIPEGAILEQSVGTEFARNGKFNILLENKDSALTRQVKESIDRRYGIGWAKITNPGTIEVKVPTSLMDDPVSFAANIENITLSVEEPNRVVINERTGTVIVGNKVRVSRVIISHNGIKIEIDEDDPQPANRAREPKTGSMIAVNGETTVNDLVEALNAVGASPKDLIAIFQAINAAGALHGELKLM